MDISRGRVVEERRQERYKDVLLIPCLANIEHKMCTKLY